MRALVIGRGAMGKRRIRDLTALGVEVESWDITDTGVMPKGKFDLMVVSTPPTKHDYYLGMPMFTEADVVEVAAPHYPSCTPLFCADIVRLTAVENPRPLVYTLHVGQNIADWHPGAPATYYAYQDGVALREMIPFELIWLTRWLGPVTKSVGLLDPKAVGINVVHRDGALGNIVIDLLARPPIRWLTQVGDGWQQNDEIRYTEAAYFKEMAALKAAVEGGSWPYSQSEEAANLDVLRSIERS